jgi:cytochrome c biogenesis protein CcmG/thiol:disulfide interchange protein DsbE
MARTEGKREAPRQRAGAKPAPKRPTLASLKPTAETAPPSGLGKKVLIWAVGLVALAGLTIMSLNLANEEDWADTLPVDVAVGVTGDALPPFTTGGDSAIGMVAPEVTSVNFEGEPSNISHDGVPKLVVFLAHWCPHCQAEVPAVQAWIDANGIPEGVEFVSVATSISSARANYPPNAWLEEESWTQRVVMDDEANTLGAVYGLKAFPYYVMLDGSGTVIQRMTGEQDPALIGAILEGLALNG